MSTYRLYKSPNGDIVRVKMGFSWQAFFVGSLSTLVRRGWLLAAVAFYAVYMLFCGVNGNRWLSDSLRRRGFTLIGEERR